MVYIILGKGFEEIEALAPGDILRRGGVEVQFAGIGGRSVTGGHGIVVEADVTVEDIDAGSAELVVVPGGLGGVDTILGSNTALKAIKTAYEAGRKVAAICAGPKVLARLGILNGVHAVCYPGMEKEMEGALMSQAESTVVDGQIITGRGAGAAIDFGLRLLEELRGRQAADAVAGGIYYERR